MIAPDESVAAQRPVLYAVSRRGGLCDAVALVASILFLTGSIFFLPFYDRTVDFNVTMWIFLAGRVGFTLAIPVYALVATKTYEKVFVLMYFICFILFDVGLAFLFPGTVAHVGTGSAAAGMALFAIGSAVLLAASVGGLAYVGHKHWLSREKLTYSKGSELFVLACNSFGTLCFLWGSLDFYSSDLNTALNQSAWLFIGGSSLFVVVAAMPYIDALVVAHLSRDSTPPLLAANAEAAEEAKDDKGYRTFS
jgi:hypothetical protein